MKKLRLSKSCVKLVKDNDNESNSQRSQGKVVDTGSCVKLVKDNDNESNSQPFEVQLFPLLAV